YKLDVDGTGRFTGALTLDTSLTIAGDTIDELAGTGLQVVGGDLQTTLGTSIEGSEITDGTIEEVDLEATNTATDNYILSYDNTTGGFTWVANDGGSGGSKFTDSGTLTYLTDTTDDFALGGSDSDS